MNKLYRSKKDKTIAGICGGLGERFSIVSPLIRLAGVFVGGSNGLTTYGRRLYSGMDNHSSRTTKRGREMKNLDGR